MQNPVSCQAPATALRSQHSRSSGLLTSACNCRSWRWTFGPRVSAAVSESRTTVLKRSVASDPPSSPSQDNGAFEQLSDFVTGLPIHRLGQTEHGLAIAGHIQVRWHRHACGSLAAAALPVCSGGHVPPQPHRRSAGRHRSIGLHNERPGAARTSGRQCGTWAVARGADTGGSGCAADHACGCGDAACCSGAPIFFSTAVHRTALSSHLLCPQVKSPAREETSSSTEVHLARHRKHCTAHTCCAPQFCRVAARPAAERQHCSRHGPSNNAGQARHDTECGCQPNEPPWLHRSRHAATGDYSKWYLLHIYACRSSQTVWNDKVNLAVASHYLSVGAYVPLLLLPAGADTCMHSASVAHECGALHRVLLCGLPHPHTVPNLSCVRAPQDGGYAEYNFGAGEPGSAPPDVLLSVKSSPSQPSIYCNPAWLTAILGSNTLPGPLNAVFKSGAFYSSTCHEDDAGATK